MAPTKKPTKTEAILAYLNHGGWKQDFSAKTTRFKKFTHPERDYALLIGSRASVRWTKGTVAQSTSYNEDIVHGWVLLGQALLKDKK